MNLLDINLKHFPHLQGIVTDHAGLPAGACEAVLTRSGGLTLRLDDRFLLSTYDPDKEADRLVARKFSTIRPGPKTVIIYGVTLGAIPRAVRRREPGCRILVLEPDLDILLLALKQIDYTKFNNVFLYHEIEICAKDFGALAALTRQGYTELWNETLFKRNPFFFEECRRRFKSIFDRRVSGRLTAGVMGEKWFFNVFSNLRFAGLPCPQEFHLSVNGSAIMIGAGPSLNGQIETLKKLQGKIPLFAVDSAVFVLNKYGLTPDYIYILDSQYFNFHHLKFCRNLHTVLIVDVSAVNEVMRYADRFKSVLFVKTVRVRDGIEEAVVPLTDYLARQFSIKLPGVQCGGSVSTSLFDFIRQLGAKRIYLAGMEFLMVDLLSHAKGSSYEKFHLNHTGRFHSYENECFSFMRKRAIRPVPGQPHAFRDFTLNMYKEWFDDAFRISGIEKKELSSALSGNETHTEAAKWPWKERNRLDDLKRIRLFLKQVINICETGPQSANNALFFGLIDSIRLSDEKSSLREPSEANIEKKRVDFLKKRLLKRCKRYLENINF